MAAVATAPRTWFRFYSEALNDRKIGRTAKTLGTDKVVVIGIWAGILSLASESPERGALLLAPGVPFTVEDMANEIGCDLEIMRAVVSQFDMLDMVGWDGDTLIVSHWSDRQFESDNSTERVRRFRERKAQRCGNVTVTDHSIAEHSIAETEQREERAQRVAIAGEPVAPEPPPVSPAPTTQSKPSPRQGRIPDKPIPQPSEAVQAYHEMMQHWPSKAQQTEINKYVAPEQVPRWQEVVKAWNLRGNKPTNVDGMLDWFRDGIPKYAGGKGNGRLQTASKSTRGGYDPTVSPEERERWEAAIRETQARNAKGAAG